MRIATIIALTMTSLTVRAQGFSVAHLRCDYQQRPLSVESERPRLAWQLVSNEFNIMQSAYEIMVGSDSLSLLNGKADVWSPGKRSSSASIQIRYEGAMLQSEKKYYWRVRVWDRRGRISSWSSISSWRMGLLNDHSWSNAQWIGYERMADSAIIIPAVHGRGKKEWGSRRNVLPLLRKAFPINKPIRSARAYVCGLGHFEFSINGRKVGDHFLDPGWTQYSKEALYVSFDVTALLRKGNNALGIMLGNGFYYVPGERYRKLTGAFGFPKLKMKLSIEYADGTSERIVSNESWKTHASPITFSSMYGGEDYDATLESRGWDRPGFNDAQWRDAVIVDGPPLLRAQNAAPVKIMDRFGVRSSRQLRSDVTVYDMGQNASAVPWIRVSGRKGDTVRIFTGELLNEDGSANQKATGSPSYFTYILNGNGEEQWHPQFTYTGYRYAQVECISGNGGALPTVKEITAMHMRNSAPAAGTFTSSSELFNKTHRLIDWAVRSNMMSVFTDCPHREKLGWLEETHLMGGSIRYNYDIATLCRKAIRDMQLSQTDSGLIPEIAPEFVRFDEPFRNSPEWGSAGILLPWYLYEWYGDEDVLQASLPMMLRYLGYLHNKSKDHLLMQGLGDWFDLGPERPGFSQLTPRGLTATAFYFYDLNIVSKVTAMLGNQQQSDSLQRVAAAVKAAFNKNFFNPTTNQYGTGSQTSNSIALYMGLCEDANRAMVLENIVKDLESGNYALTAGDIGFRYLLRVLAENDRSDLIFRMNSRADVPGYGYQLAHGATALTESWQALPSVSNNHFMLGHLMEWLHEYVGGIRPGAIGYSRIIFAPEIIGDLDSAQTVYESPYGRIQCKWLRTKDGVTVDVVVPPNTEASFRIPKGMRALTINQGKASSDWLNQFGSGRYKIVLK